MTHVRELIHRSLEGDIVPAEQVRLDEHLSVCDRCRQANAELRRNDALLARRGPLPAVGPMRQPRRTSLGFVRPVLLGAATLVFALVAGTQLAAWRAQTPASSGTPAPTVGTPAGAPASPVKVGPDARACAVVASARAYLATFSVADGTDLRCSLYTSADGERWQRATLDLRAAGEQPNGSQQPAGETVLAVGINSATGSLFAGTTYGRILRADGLGAPWRSVSEPPAGTFQPIVTGFLFDGQRGYAAMKGLLVSEDDGRTWRDSSVGIGSFKAGLETRGRFGTSAPVRSLNDVFLGIGGVLEGTTGIWATADGGRAWRRIDVAATGEYGIAARDGLIAVALPNPFDETGKPIAPARASSDGGRTWRETATLPRGVQISSMVAASNWIAAGTSEGVFLLNNDLSWTRLSPQPRGIRGIAFTNGQLYAASDQEGLWRLQLPGPAANPLPGYVVEVVDQDTVRVKLESPMMSQEFGNPVLLRANRSTEIVPSAGSLAATGVKVGDRVGVLFDRQGRDPTTGGYALSGFRILNVGPSLPPLPSGLGSCSQPQVGLQGALAACPGSGPIGTQVTIVGANCNYSGGPAIIYFGTMFEPSGVALNRLYGSVELGRFEVDPNGSFRATFTVPSELNPIQGAGGGRVVAGLYRIYSKPEGFCSTTFRVGAPP